MIDRNRSEDEPRETFSVLGSTGNVSNDKRMIGGLLTGINRYILLLSTKCRGATVRSFSHIFNSASSLSGPDAMKGNHCKHIVRFVLRSLFSIIDYHFSY